MKKIIILFAAMSALVSCLGGDSFYQSYVADITFEYDGNVYNKSFKDSLLVLSGFDDGKFVSSLLLYHIVGHVLKDE